MSPNEIEYQVIYLHDIEVTFVCKYSGLLLLKNHMVMRVVIHHHILAWK